MAYGFQIDGLVTGVSGAFSTTGFGTAPFGGGAYPITELPLVTDGADDPDRDLHERVAEISHRRRGRLIGSRVEAFWGLWDFIYDQCLTADQVELFRPYYRARTFRFVRDLENPDDSLLVHWVDEDFDPDHHFGDVHSLRFTIEAI